MAMERQTGFEAQRVPGSEPARRHTAFEKVGAQLLHCAVQPLLRGGFVDVQRGGDFPRAFVLKKPEHHGVAVRLAQPADGLVQEGRELFPGGVGGRFLKF